MKGLVLSGGGANGSFEAGILYRLYGEIEFGKVIGTSVGSLNAVLWSHSISYKSPEIFKEIWLSDIRKDIDVFKKSYFKRLSSKPPVSFSPLQKIIERHMNFRLLKVGETEVFITAVDILTGETVYVSSHESSEKDFKACLMGSIAVPFLVRPVRLGRKLLLDGGIRESAPIAKMISTNGVDHIVLALATPLKVNTLDIDKHGVDFDNSYRCMFRAMEIMMNASTRADIKKAREINSMLESIPQNIIDNNSFLRTKKKVKIDVIEPQERLIRDVLSFDEENISRCFYMGVDYGEECLKNSFKNDVPIRNRVSESLNPYHVEVK